MPDMCVVFDLDDTLYLERDYVRSGFRHVGLWAQKELGIPDFSDRAWELFEAGRRGKIFDQILQESRIRWDRSTIEHLLAIYRSHYPEIRLLPDALVCLQALHGKAPLAILSDGHPKAQRNKVAALRLKEWFDAIFLTAEWGFEYAKPSPTAFQLAQKQFGCEAELC
jgi:putative hydrolase of the HAD superfamily